MPLGRSAHKKLRQDFKRARSNLVVKKTVKMAIKKYRSTPSEKLLSKAFRELDLAIKKNIIHKGKVARLKSRLSRLLTKKVVTSVTPIKSVKKSSPRKKKIVV